ncbi:MAG: MFS transporter [Anaerolineales bacterium]|nr:MFS transporter [Anaerolineales bacterium]MCB8962552.1 MFS transporter [Ardenticatenales bacterium]
MLCALTANVVIAIPSMALTVLFEEIANDIQLSLVQVGLVWGVSSLTGLLFGLLGGVLGDRIGPRRLLVLSCVMIGVMGGSRGLATDFYTFMATSFLLGLFLPGAGVSLHKIASEWFTSAQLGLANGIISTGFASGYLLGAAAAASLLSPWLGGWRNVFFFLGGLTLFIAALWFWAYPGINHQTDGSASLLAQLPRVMKNRNVWLIALGKLGFWGCIRGFSGYLPLFLRAQGWAPNLADQTLALFFTLSLFGAIPIPALSDRIGRRKPFLLVANLMIGLSVWLMASGSTVWVFVAVATSGIWFDAVMGISITTVADTKGIGPALAGTAVGFLFAVQEVGGILSPPIGNRLALINPAYAFFFWGALALIGMIFFALYRQE